jgi:hypothetical protein
MLGPRDPTWGPAKRPNSADSTSGTRLTLRVTEVLAAANVRLGDNYSEPIVNHTDSRATALQAFRSIRSRD